MSIRNFFAAFFLGLLLFVPLATAVAQEPGDPIVRLDSNQNIELDLAVMVDDIMPRLIALVEREDPEDAEVLRQLLDALGIEALQRFSAKTKQSRDHSSSEFRVTLDPEMSESLLYRMLTTPNGSCDFARHVSRDDVVMFMTWHNFPHYLEVLLDFMASPALADLTANVPVNDGGDFEMAGFAPRRDLLPLLSGELDFFFLEPAENAPMNPMSMPYFLVLGSTDGFALRDKILEIAGLFGMDANGEMASMLDSIEPELVGDYEMKVLPFGAFAVSQEFLVIGLDPDAMRDMLAAHRGDLKVPDGFEYVFMNGPKYGAYMESLMGAAGAMGYEDEAETAWMMDLYGVLFDHLEYEEILYRSRKDGMEGTIEVKGPVLTGLYRMVPDLLDKLPEWIAAQESEKAESAYRKAIGAMDQAMTQYAAENDGAYPEDPMWLLDEGYLAEWPYSGPTPPGEFLDWGYTYHVYHDENGVVNGYVFFLYGGEDSAGFDPYSESNRTIDGPFIPESDGSPDGIVSFCYDGAALEIVQEFLAK